LNVLDADPLLVVQHRSIARPSGLNAAPMLQAKPGNAKVTKTTPSEDHVPDLIETVENGIATLTLNRPERLNALSMDIRSGLLEALERLGYDNNVGCIVLTGAGRAFCAGGDVKSMAERATAGFEPRAAGIQFSNRIPRVMRTIPKTVIAMINGVAVGAGFSMAMACDLRVAARSSRFGTGFLKIGLSGDWGGSWTLTRLVGTAKARELYLLGDMINADEALTHGVVNRVADDADLLTTTMAMARRIADLPQIAVGYAKRNLHAAETGDFQTVLDMEAFNQARCSQTEDHREAVKAFAEKRKPVFHNR
jgi:2-(1,2-epoxy-1,2-dihydrophenyl)acetyl-CoA isomerase